MCRREPLHPRRSAASGPKRRFPIGCPRQTPSLSELSSRPRSHSMQNMKLSELKAKSPAELLGVCRRARGRERLDHAQTGADVRDPQGARGQRSRDHRRRRRRSPARRFRLPPLSRRQLPPRPGRHLRLPQPDPPLLAPHRRHRRGRDPELPRKASAILRCSRSRRSISRTPRRSATRSISTT